MITSLRDQLLQSARAAVTELDATEAWRQLAAGARLLDVREEVERLAGMPEGASALARSVLELQLAEVCPDCAEPLLLICSGGNRSLLAAQRLIELGYRQVASVRGGFEAWKQAGLPVRRAGGDVDWAERYSRHLRLPQVGSAGQQRLDAARVLVVGAGGLGAPALLYLAAAGVGQITVVDDDRVDRSNLQRQVIHADARVGLAKVLSAQLSVQALNPRVQLRPMQQRVNAENVDELLSDQDLVIDGADNLPTRYLLSDACVRHRKPLVYGAVHQFEGQVTLFAAGLRRGHSPCYRCLFPQPPGADAAPNCAEAGVLGVLPGVIGLLQATEAVKWLLAIGDSLDGRLLHFDALALRFRETRLRPDPDCPVCAPEREFAGYATVQQHCAAPG